MKKICNTKAWKTLQKAWRKVLKNVPTTEVPDSKHKLLCITGEYVKTVKAMVRWNLRKHVAHGSYLVDDNYYQLMCESFTSKDNKKREKRYSSK